MQLIHRKSSVLLIAAVALMVSGWVGLACCRRSPVAAPPIVKGSGPGVGVGVGVQDIIIVDQAELDSIRAKYLVSESRGEITGVAACASGAADDACTAAARQQLREEAKKRGVGLVVITGTIVRQTFPPQISLRARLHQITPR